MHDVQAGCACRQFRDQFDDNIQLPGRTHGTRTEQPVYIQDTQIPDGETVPEQLGAVPGDPSILQLKEDRVIRDELVAPVQEFQRQGALADPGGAENENTEIINL